MYRFIEPTNEDLARSYSETIYNWRFATYKDNFSSDAKPSYQEHEIFLRKELSDSTIKWFFLIENDNLLACCSLKKEAFGDNAPNELYTLGRVMVCPDNRGKGIALTLINQSIRQLYLEDRKFVVKLEVLRTNRAAIRLYEKCGFRRVDVIGKCLIMEKKYSAE